jgi:hypothetical protein
MLGFRFRVSGFGFRVSSHLNDGGMRSQDEKCVRVVQLHLQR